MKIYVPVSNEVSAYGPDCTDDESNTCAAFIAGELEKWLAVQFPEAEIEVKTLPDSSVSYAGKVHVYSETGSEESTERRIQAYIEENWIRWAEMASAPPREAENHAAELAAWRREQDAQARDINQRTRR